MLRDFTGSFHCVAIAFAVAIAFGATQLAACGIKGPLKPAQPPAPATATPATATPTAEHTPPPAPQPPEPKP